MRAFITLEFSKEVKEKISEVQNKIKQNSEKGRFKYIDNFHITLKFLGETEDSKIESIYETLSKSLKDFKPVRLSLNGIGAFGKGEIVRTIFIKAEGDIEELTDLANIADEAAAKQGFKKEKKYTPHITIAQEVKLNIPFDKLINMLDYKIADNLIFDRVVIMKSEQIGKKRVYTPIKKIDLNN